MKTRPVPAWGTFEPIPMLMLQDIRLWVPAFRTWGEDYDLAFEIRVSERYKLSELLLMAHRDEDERRSLNLRVTYPDGRTGTPEIPPSSAEEFRVTVAGHVTDAECNGTIHIAVPPPEDLVTLEFNWPACGRGRGTIEVPTRPIVERSAHVLGGPF